MDIRALSPHTAAVPAPVLLARGLLLRTGTPADLQQIGELLADRGEPDDAVDHRLVVEDPDAGWECCAVVVDGDRVVATATLLDELVSLGKVELPAGQVELVATARGYEGRGLVRALMNWAHARSAERGHAVQVMIGIPYFYRLFGYEYAIDVPPALVVSSPRQGTGDSAPGVEFRLARPEDLPALTELQDAAQAAFDVRMPHSPSRRRWLLDHESSATWLLERSGLAVATARLRDSDGEVLVAEAAAVDVAAADELLRRAAALSPQSSLRVVERTGTVTGDRWQEVTAADSERDAQQYYVRIPDPAVLLDRLRPVLSERLANSGLDRAGRDIVLSTFRRHYRLAVGGDGLLGPVVAGGVMQAPGAANGAGVAPDQLGAVVFGAGIVAISKLRPDVYAGPDRELFDVLFPRVTADLLTYYLPY
jgi:predicted N-acetyltransferase YhbS